MMTAETLSVQEMIHKQAAVLDSEGRPVADVLLQAAEKRTPVVLSFAGLRHVTSAFLHATVGAVLLAHPGFEPLLTVVGLDNVPKATAKLAEVKKLALDGLYRQQVQQAYNTEMASC